MKSSAMPISLHYICYDKHNVNLNVMSSSLHDLIGWQCTCADNYTHVYKHINKLFSDVKTFRPYNDIGNNVQQVYFAGRESSRGVCVLNSLNK